MRYSREGVFHPMFEVALKEVDNLTTGKIEEPEILKDDLPDWLQGVDAISMLDESKKSLAGVIADKEVREFSRLDFFGLGDSLPAKILSSTIQQRYQDAVLIPAISYHRALEDSIPELVEWERNSKIR